MKTTVKLTNRFSRLDQYSLSDRFNYATEIYAVHSRVLHAPSGEEEIKRIADCDATETWMNEIRLTNGKMVGFHLIEMTEMQYRGETVAIMQSRSGLLPEYRGANRTATFPYTVLWKYRGRFPFRKVYQMFTCTHPLNYQLVSKYVPDLYPFPNRTLDENSMQRYMEFADRLGLERVPNAHPAVRKWNEIPFSSPREQQYWQKSTSPAVRFYQELCPDFDRMQGIVTFTELSVPRVLRAWAAYVKNSVVKRMEPVGVKIRRVKRQLLPASQDQKVVEIVGMPLFEGISAPALIALTESAEWEEITSGQFIFQEKEAAEHVYLITKGTALVFLESGGEKIPLDEIGRGDFVGAVSMFTGGKRAVSIRAFCGVRMLKISREKIKKLLNTYPELTACVWKAFARRAGDPSFRFLESFKKLNRETEQTASGEATVKGIAKRKKLQGTDQCILLISGEVRKNGQPVIGPAVLEVDASDEVISIKASQYMVMAG